MHIPAWISTSHNNPLRYLLLLVLVAMIFVGGCQLFRRSNLMVADPPPSFTDDADRSSLIRAAEHQLDYLEGLAPDTVLQLDGNIYTVNRLADSLRLFLDIIRKNPSTAELDRLLQEKFIIYQAAGRKKAPVGVMLVTGYYQPIFAGSLTKSPPFIYPLYSKPPSLLFRKNPGDGAPLIGRLDAGGDFVPFWTRAEIENNHLLSDSEMVYLQDPIDVYFLQIQGSGLVRLPDGTLRSVHFSASNGREYNSIGKLLVDEQKIAKEDISMQTIRTYLHRHPAEIKRIFQYNDRFIFFKWEDGEPRGSIGETLTSGRSIAVDPSSLPMGSIGYIMSRRPIISATGEVIGWMPMQRFVFPQDTGSAIKGAGRTDIYWGSGLYAETAAGSMKEEGKLYFLVKKHTPLSK